MALVYQFLKGVIVETNIVVIVGVVISIAIRASSQKRYERNTCKRLE